MHICLDELNFMLQMYQVATNHLTYIIARIFS